MEIGTVLSVKLGSKTKIMNSSIANGYITDFVYNFGQMIGQNIPKILLLMAALIGLMWGIKHFILGIGGSGTSSWLGSHWAWYDHMTYRPYKGYKRYRSRAWNAENTA